MVSEPLLKSEFCGYNRMEFGGREKPWELVQKGVFNGEMKNCAEYVYEGYPYSVG